MPGETGVTVVTTLVWFFHFHARLRVHRAPGIPCALHLRRRRFDHSSGATRAAGSWTRVWVVVAVWQL